MVMEAHELGFRLLPYESFKRENNVVAVFTPREDTTVALRWCAKKLGDAYDFGGLVGMAWVLLGRMFKKRWRNPLENSHAMFCSEMAVTMLQRAGTPWAKSLVASRVSPQDLMDLFEKEQPRAHA